MTTLMQMPDGRLIRKFVVLFVCFLVNDDDGDFLLLSFFLWCVCVCVCMCFIRAMNRTFVTMSIIIIIIIIIIWMYGCMDDGDDDRVARFFLLLKMTHSFYFKITFVDKQSRTVLLKEGTDSSQGKGQLISNINACMAIVDTIRTTLGPRGLDKLVVDNRGVTTIDDGATIMKLLEIVHPAVKTLVDIARSQDAEVGDGTTTVVLLCGEFLREAKPSLKMACIQ